MKTLICCLLLAAPSLLCAQDLEWKAGSAAVNITPTEPMTMSGYAGRKDPAEGTEQDLFAKALAIEDADGNRVLILTMDLIGVRQELREDVAAQLQEQHGLPAHALLMNASHTHCGPAYYSDKEPNRTYRATLLEKLVSVSGEALSKLEPAQLSYSHARCGFAMNRRTPTEQGFRNHPNPDGPVDHTVPVLRVANAEDELKAVLFGYACHNTTMGFLKWLGDYAGYAQACFEERHPGVTAMFMTGCGGDQNPYPRSMLYFAEKHGRSLCTSVEAALEEGQRAPLHRRPLSGKVQSVIETVALSHTEADREDFDYPVQLVQFGDDLIMVALGTEVVVDYSLRIKEELTQPEGPAIWVAAYSNVYNGYIPSKRVLEEGGYEASRPYQPDVEERILGKVHELYGKLNP